MSILPLKKVLKYVPVDKELKTEQNVLLES